MKLGTFGISNIPILIFVLKIFYQIFTTCSAQIGQQIKSTKNISKFGTFDISNMPISILMSKMIFIKSLQPVTPKLTPNWKCSGLTEIWHMWYFEYRDLDFDAKNYFLSNIYQLLRPNWSQTEKCSELLRFGRTDISNMPISVLMSIIMIFIKYLPPVRPKLVQS